MNQLRFNLFCEWKKRILICIVIVLSLKFDFILEVRAGTVVLERSFKAEVLKLSFTCRVLVIFPKCISLM